MRDSCPWLRLITSPDGTMMRDLPSVDALGSVTWRQCSRAILTYARKRLLVIFSALVWKTIPLRRSPKRFGAWRGGARHALLFCRPAILFNHCVRTRLLGMRAIQRVTFSWYLNLCDALALGRARSMFEKHASKARCAVVAPQYRCLRSEAEWPWAESNCRPIRVRELS